MSVEFNCQKIQKLVLSAISARTGTSGDYVVLTDTASDTLDNFSIKGNTLLSHTPAMSNPAEILSVQSPFVVYSYNNLIRLCGFLRNTRPAEQKVRHIRQLRLPEKFQNDVCRLRRIPDNRRRRLRVRLRHERFRNPDAIHRKIRSVTARLLKRRRPHDETYAV